MAWKIYFWLVAALVLVPLPFKAFEYVTGRDGSPTIVKVEEMVNAVFFSVGLVGLYNFVFKQPMLFASWFWFAWVGAAIAISIAGLLWSPKLKYGVAVMGKDRTRAILGIGSVFFLPMLVGVALYAAAG